jgi:cellulose synthase/poly-beta-1,6-N-acetylglucosamine synthase-like glycosyltransferase
MTVETENVLNLKYIASRVLSKKKYLAKILAIKSVFKVGILEQLAAEYFNSSKLKYLHKKLNINWIDSINKEFISAKHSSEYCLKGQIKIDNNSILLNYYGIIKLSDKSKIKHFIQNREFFACIIEHSKQFNSSKAIHALRIIDPKLCAGSYNFTYYSISSICAIFTIYLAYFNLFALLISIISSSQCVLKIFLLTKSYNKQHLTLKKAEELPIYTVLVPLYMESDKIHFIINSIQQLHYPKHRLDVKLILEEDDEITQKTLSLIKIPPHFNIIKVPRSLPRTKPKALNYAIQYIAGDYVVIFDAEDYPEPYQLIKAVSRFNSLSKNYVCLQAKLNFYNQNENILTKMQSIEYSLWFESLLVGLNNYDQFIPLGGTSCHFKVQELRKIGCWDPFNVTEDLDLGIRIYLKGYKTSLLNSITLEEAVVQLLPWLQQRARWIKGFMQSYIVFCHNRRNYNLGYNKKLIIDVFVGFSILNFLVPIFSIIAAQYNNYLIKFFVFASLILSTLYSTICAIISMVKQKKGKMSKTLSGQDIISIVLFPCYFILHTLASYLALLQLISSPFKWNKTKHGVSKLI